ncbi:MAG: aminodeoxychorismate/anthranilate synthase component II [Proteobacteria bacterium]|nr:aminodeoxychorismate/anthranilate synthase component II [Pseudomonadota bacterium]MDA1355789.1 aminodeoxychorismate/anthranilate synthase component II [Pseudomonadota bacterium]
MLLLIDNYDSFTFNLVHYLGELGAEVTIYRNDAISADEALALRPDGIVLSPGPRDPNQAGICLELIKKSAGSIPLLGVCLGHQAIGQAFGGKVVRATSLMHGKTSDIYHEEHGLFQGLPTPFTATRYHSLMVERNTLPGCLEVTAQTDDGVVMGLSHRDYPVHGVQFHPESIASDQGHELLKNFLDIVTGSGAA